MFQGRPTTKAGRPTAEERLRREGLLEEAEQAAEMEKNS